ncbi:MAG: M15 family metallopeptidase [Lachnospiraceae bacterium]|nr:M15 family metallopeptidase [Lachnospiraceae bacterium]
MFSLDDFFMDTALSDYDDSSDKNGFSKDDWSLILVNKTHPLPDDYDVKLTTIKGTMKCDERAVEPLRNMLNAANSKGISLYVCSPFRDQDRQEMLFNRRVTQYMANGKSYLEAFKTASKDVIIPGCSEHQLGLAFDIVCSYHSTLDWEFGNTEAGKWLQEHCAEYGFILRYPKGKEEITGIVYEPWHFRYVGKEAATYIMEQGITLEELWDEF